MHQLYNLRKEKVAFIIPLMMILSLVLVVKSSFFIPAISPLIIIDLLIVIPLVHYLIIRKKKIQKQSVVLILFLGFITALSVIPKEYQYILDSIQLIIIPLIELTALIYIIIKVRQVVKGYKEYKSNNFDFFDVIKPICNKILPFGIGNILAAEIAMIYYALFSWKKKRLLSNEFSYHKNSTSTSVFLGFLVIVMVEAFVTHVMIQQGIQSGSVVLAILSGYSALQIIAMMRSTAKRPVVINKDKEELVLRFGILSEATISFKNLKKVVITSKDIPEKSPIKYFSPLGSATGHNMVICLNEPIVFNSFYGFKRKAKYLAIFIDEKEAFQTQLLKVLA